jgi:hypothetical protein
LSFGIVIATTDAMSCWPKYQHLHWGSLILSNEGAVVMMQMRVVAMMFWMGIAIAMLRTRVATMVLQSRVAVVMLWTRETVLRMKVVVLWEIIAVMGGLQQHELQQ